MQLPQRGSVGLDFVHPQAAVRLVEGIPKLADLDLPALDMVGTSCRCIRPRFMLCVPDGELLARNLIQGTATSWPTTCAPTDTDCTGWNSSNLECASCRPWCGFAMTGSAPGLRTNQLAATTLAAHWPGPRDLSRWHRSDCPPQH
jgi:hypothetical protein